MQTQVWEAMLGQLSSQSMKLYLLSRFLILGTEPSQHSIRAAMNSCHEVMCHQVISTHITHITHSVQPTSIGNQCYKCKTILSSSTFSVRQHITSECSTSYLIAGHTGVMAFIRTLTCSSKTESEVCVKTNSLRETTILNKVYIIRPIKTPLNYNSI